MASHDIPRSQNNAELTKPSESVVDDVVEAVAKVSLQDEVPPNEKTRESPTLSLKVYTRYELLQLSKSPLVKAPEGMPAFKEWFGDWNEQVGSKKESDTSAPANTRDRRFRRDADDGDSARPSFRSGLSQPSQMGNFRHQSIRTTADRPGPGDKEQDRERERELRDREGQERLRNLSDKYDRDRLAQTSASTLRNKERDVAPHLSGTSSTRLGQTQTTGRRGETRDASKRKAGENSDDWRRGAEPSKAGRDGGTDSRRDRDTRDRPRSRVRDSSRSRRDPSTTRRDREDRDRPRDRRGDGDRDDRRDKDDYVRRDWDDAQDRDREDPYPRDGRDRYDHARRARDRDLDRDVDDDPRRWRDDGRRDERMAVRRERETRERGWDRFEDRDRERPSGGDDRDARTRRGTARDRRLGGSDDATRDDRRDRDKEREAVPAWMETYVPTNQGGGILGGKGADGELDGIQVWKKGMKEKERKEKGEDSSKAVDSNGASDQPPSSTPPAPNGNGGSPMDEIQLFKLMMKREAEKKDGETAHNGVLNHTLGESAPPGLSSSSSLQSQKGDAINIPDSATIVQRASDIPRTSQENNKSSPRPEIILAAPSGSVVNLPLSLVGEPSRSVESSSPLDRSPDISRVVGHRVSQATPGMPILSPVDLSGPGPSGNTFNPPPGSRVLALKSRLPSGGPVAPPGIAAPHTHPLQSGVSGLPAHFSEAISHDMQLGGPRMSDTSRGTRSFSPLSNGSQSNIPVEDTQEHVYLGQMNDGLRRASGSSAAERAIIGLPGEGGSPYADLAGFPPGVSLDPSGNALGGGHFGSANKGSRFAKFFDSKTREVQSGGPRLSHQPPGMSVAASHPNQRQESISLGGIGVPRGERTMEDIFAMLQSSTQGHRGSPQIAQTGRMPTSSGQYPQSTLELQLQQQLHQRQLAQNRLDLYDSRVDDRNFVPDGLVPGLRPAPPRSRSRESGGVLFNEQIDDPLHFNVQRLSQPRNMEQLYNAPMPPMYHQQAGMLRNGVPMQQGQFRGASPISSQNVLQAPSQRLPPGLANLGGRPPHDPSQYLNSGVGLPGGGLHGASPAQQVYNTFTQGGLGYNGNPQVRGPPGPQTPLSVNPMGGLGPNNLDLRAAANQAQLLGLAQGNLGGGGMRGSGPGFGPQHGMGGQLSASHAMRQQLQQQQQQQHQQQHQQHQQQQQQFPPHMMQHMLPTHLQQQGIPGGNAQTTQDLMALLMGGHRE